MKDHPQSPHHLPKYEGKGTTISIFKLFSELGKIWKMQSRLFKKTQFPISFMNWEKPENIHSPRLTFQNPNVESMDELGKLMS